MSPMRRCISPGSWMDFCTGKLHTTHTSEQLTRLCREHLSRDEIIYSGGQFSQCRGGRRVPGRKGRLKTKSIKGEESVGAEPFYVVPFFKKIKASKRERESCSTDVHTNKSSALLLPKNVLNHDNAEINAGFVVNHFLTSMDTNNTKICVRNK